MEISTRLFNYEQDSQIVNSWWSERNQLVIEKDYLSDYGVLAFINNKAVGCMWLYPVLSTKWSMIRFPITDPKSSKVDRELALDLIFDNIHNISKDMGYKYMFCTSNHPSLIKRLEKYNYVLDSKECSHFWGKLR